MFMHQHWTIKVRRSDWPTDNDMNQNSVNTVPILLFRCPVGLCLCGPGPSPGSSR